MMASQITSSEVLESQLLQELAFFKEILGDRGSKLVTHGPRSLGRFRLKDCVSQQKILDDFIAYSRLISSAVQEDPDCLRDEVRLLRKVLSSLHIMISEEVFEELEQDTIVEIYNKDLLQVYRSLRFMDICGYTLLDLLTYEFYELYERSASINRQLIGAFETLRSRTGLKGLDVSAEIPKHLMREKFSEARGVSQIEFRRIFPVHRWPKEFFGVVTTLRASQYPDYELDDSVEFI